MEMYNYGRSNPASKAKQAVMPNNRAYIDLSYRVRELTDKCARLERVLLLRTAEKDEVHAQLQRDIERERRDWAHNQRELMDAMMRHKNRADNAEQSVQRLEALLDAWTRKKLNE